MEKPGSTREPGLLGLVGRLNTRKKRSGYVLLSLGEELTINEAIHSRSRYSPLRAVANDLCPVDWCELHILAKSSKNGHRNSLAFRFPTHLNALVWKHNVAKTTENQA